MKALNAPKPNLASGKIKVNAVKPGETVPNFPSFFDARGLKTNLPDAPNNLTPDNLQETENAETSAMLAEIIKAKKEARDRYRTRTDPNYYIVVCFQNTDQKDEFLKKSKWADEGTRFMDGLALAKKLGIGVAPINLKPSQPRNMAKVLRGHSVIE